MTTIQQHRRNSDLRYFCFRELKIKAKEGGRIPFLWNKAQQYLHAEIEDQLRRTGMVRKLVLKGRQQGISTYVSARYYHRSTRAIGINVFILSHHSTTTTTLFQIVETYHAGVNPVAAPSLIVNNNKRMEFDIGSQYTVGTARTGAIGRGDTNQLFHGSEVAFYDNPDEIMAGALQTVADVPGTEIILESTANGMGNYFHRAVLDAVSGRGLFELVFIPWFWQDEYRTKPRKDFSLTLEEEKLKHLYDLDDSQMQWRRDKIISLKSESKFKQEYPCNVQEAFQASGTPLIEPERVEAARKSKIRNKTAPLVIGVDVGRSGDPSVVARRRGNDFQKFDKWYDMDLMEQTGKLANIINKEQPVKMFIDVAEGSGIISRLKELGYGDIVSGIAFGSRADEEEVYVNKRAEMAGRVVEWFNEESGCRVPDDDEVSLEFGAIPTWKSTSSGKLQLESKDKIKETLGHSPDIWDAFKLTFAQAVSHRVLSNKIRKSVTKKGDSELHTSNRRRQTHRPSTHTDFYDDDDMTGFYKTGPTLRRR